MKSVLTTRELAEAIGVSESSLKRWADDGKVRASRTAGGHRRIPLGEAIRFVRESGATVLRPDLLGLSGMQTHNPTLSDRATTGETLYEALAAGEAERVRGLVVSLYLNGWTVATICDGPIRSAMYRLGELWRHDPAGIFTEHRATNLCVQALHYLRVMLVEPGDGALVTVGGAKAGDPYMIPSLMASLVLTDVGFHAVNLGPDVPLSTLETAVREQKAVMGWLSISTSVDAGRLRRDIEDLAEQLDMVGASLVMGGQGIPEGLRLPQSGVHLAKSMGELEAYARGLLASQPVGEE